MKKWVRVRWRNCEQVPSRLYAMCVDSPERFFDWSDEQLLADARLEAQTRLFKVGLRNFEIVSLTGYIEEE